MPIGVVEQLLEPVRDQPLERNVIADQRIRIDPPIGEQIEGRAEVSLRLIGERKADVDLSGGRDSHVEPRLLLPSGDAHERSVRPEGPDPLIERGVCGSRIEDHVDALGRVGTDRVPQRVPGGIDDGSRTEPHGRIAPGRGRFTHDDRIGPRRPRHLQDREPDRPAPEHQHRRPEQRRRPTHRVHRHRDRLRQGRLLDGERCGHAMGRFSRDHDITRQTAIERLAVAPVQRDAPARVPVTAATGAAASTCLDRRDRDGLALGQVVHPLPYHANTPGELVTEDDAGHVHGGAPRVGAEIGVQVATADAVARDFDQELSGPGLGHAAILDAQIFRSVPDRRGHLLGDRADRGHGFSSARSAGRDVPGTRRRLHDSRRWTSSSPVPRAPGKATSRGRPRSCDEEVPW